MTRSLRVADRWFERVDHANGITQLWEPHVHRFVRCNVWHVRGRDRDLIVDTGVGVASVSAELANLLDRPVVCVATHFHFDHIGCFHEFDDRRMHPIEAPDMDPYLHSRPLVLSDTEDAKARLAKITEIGYKLNSDVLIDALPNVNFDQESFVTV